MYERSNRSTRILRFLIAVSALALIASACASTRPSVAEWQPTWIRVVAGIPPQDVVGENPPRELCDRTLEFLRENRADLSPTPDIAVDDTVREWIDIAEGAFFECPPASQQMGSFAEAYEILERLQAEVDVVLDMDRGS